jgi:hypothetical protein
MGVGGAGAAATMEEEELGGSDGDGGSAIQKFGSPSGSKFTMGRT